MILTETRKAVELTNFQKYSMEKPSVKPLSSVRANTWIICFISYLALWSRNFFTPGQEEQIEQCIWQCLGGNVYENICKQESTLPFTQQNCIMSWSQDARSLCQSAPKSSLLSSWGAAGTGKIETQLQGSHLSSLPRKALEKYLWRLKLGQRIRLCFLWQRQTIEGATEL